MHKHTLIQIGKLSGLLLTILLMITADSGRSRELSPSVRRVKLCDLLEQLGTEKTAPEGELISVQGEVSFRRHDVAIIDNNCAAVPEAGGRKWPAAIRLVPAADKTLSLPRVRGIADADSVKKAEAKLQEIISEYVLKLQTPPRVSGDFVGLLRTPDKETLAKGGPAAGFGDQGALLAELEYIAAALRVDHK